MNDAFFVVEDFFVNLNMSVGSASVGDVRESYVPDSLKSGVLC